VIINEYFTLVKSHSNLASYLCSHAIDLPILFKADNLKSNSPYVTCIECEKRFQVNSGTMLEKIIRKNKTNGRTTKIRPHQCPNCRLDLVSDSSYVRVRIENSIDLTIRVIYQGTGEDVSTCKKDFKNSIIMTDMRMLKNGKKFAKQICT
jgi:hypothetical protein